MKSWLLNSEYELGKFLTIGGTEIVSTHYILSFKAVGIIG
jgi:hypothetical protein